MTKKIISIEILILGLFWLLFFCFQNESIYHQTLGRFSDNWQNTEGNRVLADVVYAHPNNVNMVQWDAKHYQLIKENGYDVEKAGGDFIYAFFPLFPAIWKISQLPPLGVLFLNYLFFAAGLFVLLYLFSNKDSYVRHLLLSFSLPGLIIFLIPYTEATYFLMVSVGILGYVKKKYWIYFVGFFLAALTRPSFTFLLLSVAGAEVFFLLSHRNFGVYLKNSFIRILPLICGTALVSIIQFAQGSKTVFKFIQVQKYWENIFGIPHNIKDWSHEGFGINLGIVVAIFIPLLVILIQLLIQQLGKIKSSFEYNHASDYLVLVSLLYLIGNTLFVLLFRGGSLNCLFRFTICSPFTFILLFCGYDYLKNISINIRRFFFGTMAFICILLLGLIDYSTFWNFSDFGMFLLLAVLVVWLFQDQSEKKAYRILQYALLVSNCIWTTYLFNMYIVDGWIFA